MTIQSRPHLDRWLSLACLAVIGGCAASDRSPAESVSRAWRRAGRAEASPAPLDPDESAAGTGLVRDEGVPDDDPIATVNGQPVPRRRFMETLLQSHGARVLDQFIGLETAMRAAKERGLRITPSDVEREYDRTLRRLANPLASLTPERLDREAAGRLLDVVLSERNLSRDEFDLVMRRNAYLRKLVEQDQEFTEAQLRQEFERVYGRRVRVRHIQLATLGEVERVKERLNAGEDFGQLAARYSANMASAEANGLLDPFSAEDEAVPALFRKVAFALKPGEVSSAVRIGPWYHLIKVEEVLPGEAKGFAGARDRLKQSLRERLTEPAMFRLFEKLFQEATIEIHDAALRTAFEKRHLHRGR